MTEPRVGSTDVPGLVVDLDGTLAMRSPTGRYEDCPVNEQLLARLLEYREGGSRITIATARNMRTYASNQGLINANTLPVILDWLASHDVPYDELYVAKPWPGPTGFYVDDRSIRPNEFLEKTPDEIQQLLRGERA